MVAHTNDIWSHLEFVGFMNISSEIWVPKAGLNSKKLSYIQKFKFS